MSDNIKFISFNVNFKSCLTYVSNVKSNWGKSISEFSSWISLNILSINFEMFGTSIFKDIGFIM